LIWRRLEVLVRSEDHSRRQVNSELAGFNPIELKFWKGVRLHNDELVDVAVVEWFPQVLLLHW
jgi:hypothetical protein